ncbi:MAG TPA: hypothetical protein VLE73_02010 [Candidatus Saccharimonadales bacterium]|nr:hypothetical protein [Candidatus Saccharimonadales bacterium]
MSSEIAPNSDALAQYRQLDPMLVLGGIPIAQCLQLTEAVPDDIPPEARYDSAWLALETSLAMSGSNDPSSGRKFAPKQIQGAIERARIGFRSVARDPEATLVTGLRAQIALAGVPVHHETLSRSKVALVSPHFNSYASSLYKAAQSLVALPEFSPEETELANIVTALGIGTEVAREQAYFLLASPRQPWHINGISRQGGTGSRIIVGREPSPDLTVIPPGILTTPRLQESGEPFPTLAAFARQKVGFGTRWNGVLVPGLKHLSQRKPSAAEVELLQVGDQMIAALNEQHDKGVPVVIAAGALVLKSSETDEIPVTSDGRPETAWYQSQAASDVHAMPRKNFLAHLETLTNAAKNGELNPRELQSLAWMQIDNGRALARLAAAEAKAATRERAQIIQANPERGQQHRRDAERHETRHRELLEELDAQFDAATESLQTALARTRPEHAGDALEIRLDAEAIPVYKALFTETSPEALQNTVDTYLQRVASLAPHLRDAIKKVRRNNEQLDSILANSARAALILILTGASDEGVRHVMLPTGPRAGGRYGKADMLIFPIDDFTNYAASSYDTANPLTLNLIPGNDEVTFTDRHINLGKYKLAKTNSGVTPLMLRLASVVRTFKGGRNKRQSHGEAMNTLALELSDAVADATE